MIDLSGREDVPVPEAVLAELTAICDGLDLQLLVIGAAARDLTIHAPQRRRPVRATRDIDVAVAMHRGDQFGALADRLVRRGGGEQSFEVLGVAVDVVPFGGIERGREIRFADDHLLDVNGLQEALATAVRVLLPQGTEVRVASPSAQTALKILAWRDRHQVNAKDGLDLGIILNALSEDPFVGEVWDDDAALDATGADIVAAAAFHYGHRAALPFSPQDGSAVTEVLRDDLRRDLLRRHMRSAFAADLLDAYLAGFQRGLAH